ncbi:MAG: 2-hydroxychromene-2-carboxylate isomerase [Litoreibacter sp.]|nr:2-hydroxychromene-2-carboxylate isomerase [Litoreibacter sp.]MCY4336026.1 2-hydroxychromene-2-carboxylate isomerase [Litoreibacter sp.]
MPHIDYYFATLSPYTYMAGTRMEAVAAKHGATIRYKPLSIMDLFARTGGTPPPQRHINRQEWRLQEMRRSAKKLGLPMNLKPAHWPTNPAPSSYAIIAAQNEGGGDLAGLVHGFVRAVWAEEKDVADDAVVREVLEAHGFDASLADKGMLAGAEEYGANLEEAVEKGAFGAPFYITDTDERFWGQDKIDDLDLFFQGKL